MWHELLVDAAPTAVLKDRQTVTPSTQLLYPTTFPSLTHSLSHTLSALSLSQCLSVLEVSVLYGLDRVGWLAVILGLGRCVDDLEPK